MLKPLLNWKKSAFAITVSTIKVLQVCLLLFIVQLQTVSAPSSTYVFLGVGAVFVLVVIALALRRYVRTHKGVLRGRSANRIF